MAKSVKIEPRTEQFIKEYWRLKGEGELPVNEVLAKKLKMPSKSTVSEILGKRQNVQPESWEIFKEKFHAREVSRGTDNSEQYRKADGKSEKDEPLSGEIMVTLGDHYKMVLDYNAYLKKVIDTGIIVTNSNLGELKEILVRIESRLDLPPDGKLVHDIPQE